MAVTSMGIAGCIAHAGVRTARRTQVASPQANTRGRRTSAPDRVNFRLIV
jgi:hypothetical protein